MAVQFRSGDPPDPAAYNTWQGYASALTAYLRETFKEVERTDLERNPRPDKKYTITNDTEDRDYDANATSTAELADVLATLIRDLALQGRFRTKGS